MISLVILLCLAQSSHQNSFVHPQGYFNNELQFADADGDGDLDLFVAIYTDGRRFIDVYHQHLNVFSATPQQHIEIPRGVVAWATGNFLPEEGGDELIFTASRGVYVRNATGRTTLLSRESLLLDVPFTFSAPLLNTVADIDNDGLPEMVVITTSGYQIIQHDGVVSGVIDIKPKTMTAPVAASSWMDGRVRPSLSGQRLSSLFVPNEGVGVLLYPPALYSSVELPAPVWADVNGDGLLDLSYVNENQLFVHLQSANHSFLQQADRVYPLPKGDKSNIEQLEWLPISGKAQADLLFVSSRDDILSQTRPWLIKLFIDPWQKKDLNVADATFKAQSTALGVQLLDINGDGLLDVCKSNWSLDLGLFVRSGSPKLVHVASAILGKEGGWQSRSAFAEKRSMNFDDIESLVATDSFAPSLTSNGLPDLVEISDAGSFRVRQLEVTEGAIGVADSNTIDLPLQALDASVKVKSLNSDNISDIVIIRSGSIEIYLSVIK